MHEDYGSHSVCMPDTTLAATYMYIDTYIHTYIHRYSEFAICYSCIRGSLRLVPNYVEIKVPLRFLCHYLRNYITVTDKVHFLVTRTVPLAQFKSRNVADSLL